MDSRGTGPELIELKASRKRAGARGTGGAEGVEVRAGGRVVGTLTPASITALGLRDGGVLTPEVEERIRSRVVLERAYKAAGDALARRALTGAELRERLERRGFDGPVVEETVGALMRQGLVNDAEVAREVVRHSVAHGGAGAALLESKLAAKGVDAGTARRILDEELSDAGGSALEAARRRAPSLPEELSVEAKARRLYAYLARRGFDEHESTEAVRRTLGTSPNAGAEG